MPNENKLWERPTKNVIFISQSEAERLEPVAGAAMISITDPDKSPATLGRGSCCTAIASMMAAILRALSTR